MDERTWKGLLERFGQAVTVTAGGEERSLRAFFHPVTERGVGSEPTPLGVRPVGKWRYLGPPDAEVEEGGTLAWEGRGFRFLRVRRVPLGERTFYVWGLCEEMDRGETP